MIAVESWDALLKTGVDFITDRIQSDEIKIGDDLIFRVCVKGASWDGSIDYRGASFVLELQKAVNRIYKELREPGTSLHNLNRLITVKVKVIEGSSIFEIKVDEVIKKLVEKMSGKEITLIAALGILSATGYFTTRTVLDFKKQTIISAQQQQLTDTVINKLTDTIDKALEIIEQKDIEAPARKLVSTLETNDTIILPGRDEITAKTAKNLYPKKQALPQRS